MDGGISNELKDFDIRSLSKDDFKHNVCDKHLLEDRFPDTGFLEAFSVFDSTNWPREQLSYLPVYKSTCYNLKICPKNRPWLIHESKPEIKKSSPQLCIIIDLYGNKHPLLHRTSSMSFPWSTLAVQVKMLLKIIIAYLKRNFEIKDTFLTKILTQKKEKLICLAPK